MEMYLAFVFIVVVLSLILEPPIVRYLTGYSWPAAFLLILVTTIVYSLLWPLLALSYIHELQKAPTTEHYLTLSITLVFIKTVVDTFVVQLFPTVFISSNSNISSPPFIYTFKLLFIANAVIIAIVAWLHIKHQFPVLIEFLGITRFVWQYLR